MATAVTKCSDFAEASMIVAQFKEEQPGIVGFLPTAENNEDGLQNTLLSAMARRLCTMFKHRHGCVPVLKEADLWRYEKDAAEHLEKPEFLKAFENMAAIRALHGILNTQITWEGVTMVPDRKRFYTVHLTILLCLSLAAAGASNH